MNFRARCMTTLALGIIRYEDFKMNLSKIIYKTGKVEVTNIGSCTGQISFNRPKARVSRAEKAARIITEEEILAWADAYKEQKKGRHPTNTSGPVFVLDEQSCPVYDTWMTWGVVNNALNEGKHGLKGGQTLFQFLEQQGRAVKNTWEDHCLAIRAEQNKKWGRSIGKLEGQMQGPK